MEPQRRAVSEPSAQARCWFTTVLQTRVPDDRVIHVLAGRHLGSRTGEADNAPRPHPPKDVASAQQTPSRFPASACSPVHTQSLRAGGKGREPAVGQASHPAATGQDLCGPSSASRRV